MVIGGFQAFSLSEYPGKLCAIVFTRGCNFRCSYCHNPELVDPQRYATPISEEFVLNSLHKRRHLLSAVCMTGGEPTLHPDLADFLGALKKLGYMLKIETNGSQPLVLESLAASGLVDFFAMDIKSPPASYSRIAGAPVDMDAVQRSLRFIVAAGIPHELRTTFHESLHSPEDIMEIGEMARGCDSFVLQTLRPARGLDPSSAVLGQPSPVSLKRAVELLQKIGVPVRIR